MGKHNHAFELPPMEQMWAQAEIAAAERHKRRERQEQQNDLAEVIPLFERVDDGRQTARTEVALRCWLNLPTQSKRAWVINLSTDGVRVDGIAPVPVGTRVLLKVCFSVRDAPMSTFAEVVRIDDEGCTCLRFLAPEWSFFAQTESIVGPTTATSH